MLRNIPESISPELMLALMQMGHGDDIVIGDVNFPSFTMSRRCVYAKGLRATEILAAILGFMPLDVFVDDPVTVMRPGALYDGVPPVWDEYADIIKKNDFCGAFKGFAQIEREDFYERARKSFVTVQTSESALYACLILKKGVIGSFSASD
jgi:L-fucose mutarotase